MDLQKRMMSMQPYLKGIDMYNEGLIVRVQLPSNWKPYPAADGRIKVTPSETKANEYFYYANSEETTYDEMFDLIEETIKFNNDIKLKLELLRVKVEELKELFNVLSYDELTTLEFKTKKQKEAKKPEAKKPMKKRGRKPKVKVEEVPEVVTEETVEAEVANGKKENS